MPDVVFDASVVLTAVFREKGYEQVLSLEQTAMVSAVNIAEARSRLADHGLDRRAIDESLGLIDMRIVDFDAEQASLSSDLRKETRKVGLSLGDRACLALAMQKGAVAYTADKVWANVSLPIEVKVIR
jgi:PIN domain nuclease of toxin-antitoxin system